MSIKWLFVAAALGSGYYAVSQAEPPVPAGATAADSLAFADVSMMERFQYSVGSVGASILGGSIRRSVYETEASLQSLKKPIRNARGSDGVRARALEKKIMYMDSVAVENLHQGKPIKAMKQSMEAKSMLNMVQRSLATGV